MQNKILLILESLNKQLSEDLILQVTEYLSIKTTAEVINNLGVLGDYKYILDASASAEIFNFAGQSMPKLSIETYEHINIMSQKLYKIGNVELWYNLEKQKFFEPEIKSEFLSKKEKFKKFLLKILNEINPEINFKELEVEANNKKYKLVETIPVEKEKGTEYILIKTAKDLNRILEIIEFFESDQRGENG